MKDDDLFAETSMSFGEHLEELRKCFINSLYAIVAGTIVGFFFGAWVVDYIQIPVRNSLQKYYTQQSLQRLDTVAQELEREGYPREIVNVPKKFEMVPVEMYIFPGELERVLERQRHQRREAEGGLSDGMFRPGEVDNLISRTIEFEQRRSEILGGGLFAYGSGVQLDEEPLRMLFFTKIADDPKTRPRALSVHEVFGIYIKASLVVGVLIASPVIAFNLWSFVAAGLYPHEKRYVYYYIPVSIALFVGGALFAFFFVFQFVLDFLFGFNSWMHIDPDPRINEWIGFALMLPVGFGASFQLPLVMFVLERVGIFTFRQYLSSWRISILAIFVLALLLTPGDPGSMLMMAIPLTALYFGGIFFCWAIPRKKGIFDYDDQADEE